MLADVIDKRGGINLQGMAVGNGCWGNGVELYCGFGKEQRRIESDFLYGQFVKSLSTRSHPLLFCWVLSLRDLRC